MADDVANHVTVDISVDSVGVPREGFGTMMIASHNANAWSERTRSYASTLEAADDWATTSPEYRGIAAAFAQTPKPEIVKIGRVSGDPLTLVYTVDVSSVEDEEDYTLGVDGQGFDSVDAEYTSDVAATQAEIHSGLVTALNAVTGKNFTAGFAALVYADNTFVGEADDDTLTMATALVFADRTFTAAASDIVTMAAHTLLTGDGPFQLTTSAADLPLNLLTATDYWIIRLDADTFSFASTRALALAGTAFDIGDAGTGVHTMADTAETRRVVAHTLLTGDGPFQVSTTGGLPTGLVAVTDYWIIRMGVYTFKLATTLALALAGTAIALTTDGTGVQTIADTTLTKRPDDAFTVTGDAPGNWFSLDIPDAQFRRLTLQMTHAAGTLSDELALILDEDDEWYTLMTLYNSKGYVLEAALFIEGVGRTYVVDVPDTTAVTTVVAGATDTLAALLAFGYARTMYSFHPRPAAMFSAGWMGRWLPTLPGKATPKFKTLNGIETVKLTSTMRTNLINRRGNSYERAGGRGIAFEGTVGNTVYAFFDVVRNRDWLADQVRSEVFGIQVGADIIPYTAEGTAMVYGGVRGIIFGIAIEQGVIANDPEPVVTAPKISAVSSADKVARILRNVKFNGTLQGAVHKVAVVGSVSF